DGAVDDRALVAGEPHARALGAGLQTLTGEHDAGLRHLFVVLAHGVEQFGARHDPGFAVLARLDDQHEPWHCCISLLANGPWKVKKRLAPGVRSCKGVDPAALGST